MNVDTNPTATMRRRRSIRRYLPQPVERGAILRILEAATTAPSSHNRQPWRFALIESGEGKKTLATAMGRRLRADRDADGDDPLAVDADVMRSFARLTEAPAIIVVCIDLTEMDRYPDDRRRKAEYVMAVQSTAMAVQNMLLAAEQEQLGTCIMCAPLFCPEIVSAALRLPREWESQMLVTIGKPAAPGKIRPRKPLNEVVLWPAEDQPAR